MFKLIIPLLLLLLINSSKFWWITVASLLLMTFIFMTNLTQLFYNTMSITPLSTIDTMSSTLICLSMLITALMMASYKNSTLNNMPILFSSMNLTLLITLINCFSSSNTIMFYIWFEASLISIMVIIMTWGYQPEHLQANMYLMMYTITASLPMFIMFCSMHFSSNHLLMTMSSKFSFHSFFSMSLIFWVMILMGLLVKLPVFSTHLLLPKAHVKGSIAGSMVLALILLKLGGRSLTQMSYLFQNMIHLSPSILMFISMISVASRMFIIMNPNRTYMKLILAGGLPISLMTGDPLPTMDPVDQVPMQIRQLVTTINHSETAYSCNFTEYVLNPPINVYQVSPITCPHQTILFCPPIVVPANTPFVPPMMDIAIMFQTMFESMTMQTRFTHPFLWDLHINIMNSVNLPWTKEHVTLGDLFLSQQPPRPIQDMIDELVDLAFKGPGS